MMPRHLVTRRLAQVAAMGALILCIGCSGSTTDPGGGNGNGNGGGDGGGYTDVPDLPTPASPGGDVPAESDTVSRVALLTGTFNPLVTDTYGAWLHIERCTGRVVADQRVVDWASRANASGNFSPVTVQIRNRRLLLQRSDGSAVAPERSATRTPDCGALPLPGDVDQYAFKGEALAAPVYVRRDRHWELKPLEGNVGGYLLVFPNTSGEVATSYTSGTERSQTEEFGRSLTATVGASYGVLSATVSGTLSQTFSSSVSVNESTTETFTKSVTGKDGKIIQFMVWELVEDYRFTDAEGNPLDDANFVFAPDRMTRRGVAIALQSTEFDQPQAAP